MAYRWLAATAAATLLAATAAHGAPDLATAFGARPAAHGMVLSPLGTKALFLGPVGTNGTAVFIVDLASGKTNIALGNKTNAQVPESCGWKSETRLICTTYGIVKGGQELVSFTRVVAVDADGTNVKQLGQRDSFNAVEINQYSGRVIDWLPDDADHVLMQIRVAQEVTTGTRLAAAVGGASVQRVDVRTGLGSMVVAPNPTIAAYGTDGHGNVRFKATLRDDPDGYSRSKLSYYIRGKDGSWRPFGALDLNAVAGLEFEGFDETGDWAYVLKPLDGRQALYKVATDDSDKSELVFARPDVDIDGVVRLGKYRRPVGVDFTTDKYQRGYFDAALLKLDLSLTKALPGHPEVETYSETWDGTKRLVFADSSRDPGTYYVFDSSKRELNELLPQRPQLKGLPLSETKPVQYRAADGTMIPAYLTLPPAGVALHRAIVMPHGGPAARDGGGFDWLAQYFAQSGYAVLQPNYRGSSGYGEAWYKDNGFKSWKIAMGDVNDGARWMVAQQLAPADKLAIVGWSYGGYAALQANVLDPALYKVAVAVAPVTDLEGLKRDAQYSSNFRQVVAFIGDGPHVAAGSPARNAAAIRVPVLMFSGDHDLNVDVSQAKTMDAALTRVGKPHEFKLYPGLDHQLDDSAARADLLHRATDFLDAALK